MIDVTIPESTVTSCWPWPEENNLPQRKVWVYIASPYTHGDKLQNTLDQFYWADILLRKGFFPYPSLWPHFWNEYSPKPESEWLEYDKEALLKCDCLLRLPGESSGADNEIQFAKQNLIPVFYSIKELEKYYGP